jgi:hypothetical protein
MDIKKLFGTDRKAEEVGVWVDIGQGARVKVARETSVRYREKLRDVLRPYRGAITAGALDDKQSQALFAKAAAGTLLLDWAGIEDNGIPVAFDLDAAERLLTAYPDFYRTIESFSKEASLFREASEDAEQKN